MTRANLFATATATTIGLRRSSNASIHGPSTRERAFGYRTTVRAPNTRRWRRYRSPCLVMPPSLFLPPDEFCLGVKPSQAANSRPDRNVDGSGMVAANAVAVIGPMPGTVASKRQIVLFLWISANRASMLSICWFNASSCPMRASRAKHASSGRSFLNSSNLVISVSTRCLPWATMTPYSAKCERNAQAAMVRCRTRSPRALCSIRKAWSSRDLIGTKRIFGRVTASQMAAASEASFFAPRLT